MAGLQEGRIRVLSVRSPFLFAGEQQWSREALMHW
jgi:hypothetical protein